MTRTVLRAVGGCERSDGGLGCREFSGVRGVPAFFGLPGQPGSDGSVHPASPVFWGVADRPESRSNTRPPREPLTPRPQQLVTQTWVFAIARRCGPAAPIKQHHIRRRLTHHRHLAVP